MPRAVLRPKLASPSRPWKRKRASTLAKARMTVRDRAAARLATTVARAKILAKAKAAARPTGASHRKLNRILFRKGSPGDRIPPRGTLVAGRDRVLAIRVFGLQVNWNPQNPSPQPSPARVYARAPTLKDILHPNRGGIAYSRSVFLACR
jgi:hypothetical protein